jgi:hypothetical protein
MTSAVSNPVSRDSSMVSTDPLAQRCRGTWYVLPSSICARIGHSEPGRYLPSWPRNKILAAAGTGSGDPSPATSRRQAFMVASNPSSTASIDPAAVSGPILASAPRIPVHCSATA